MDDRERIDVLREYSRLHRTIHDALRKDEGTFVYWEREEQRDDATRMARAAQLQIARIEDDVSDAARAARIKFSDLAGWHHPDEIDYAVEVAVTRLRRKIEQDGPRAPVRQPFRQLQMPNHPEIGVMEAQDRRRAIAVAGGVLVGFTVLGMIADLVTVLPVADNFVRRLLDSLPF